jgi:hypothetical protein
MVRHTRVQLTASRHRYHSSSNGAENLVGGMHGHIAAHAALIHLASVFQVLGSHFGYHSCSDLLWWCTRQSNQLLHLRIDKRHGWLAMTRMKWMPHHLHFRRGMSCACWCLV